jgi:hypothetical protein
VWREEKVFVEVGDIAFEDERKDLMENFFLLLIILYAFNLDFVIPAHRRFVAFFLQLFGLVMGSYRPGDGLTSVLRAVAEPSSSSAPPGSPL